MLSCRQAALTLNDTDFTKYLRDRCEDYIEETKLEARTDLFKSQEDFGSFERSQKLLLSLRTDPSSLPENLAPSRAQMLRDPSASALREDEQLSLAEDLAAEGKTAQAAAIYARLGYNTEAKELLAEISELTDAT